MFSSIYIFVFTLILLGVQSLDSDLKCPNGYSNQNGKCIITQPTRPTDQTSVNSNTQLKQQECPSGKTLTAAECVQSKSLNVDLAAGSVSNTLSNPNIPVTNIPPKMKFVDLNQGPIPLLINNNEPKTNVQIRQPTQTNVKKQNKNPSFQEQNKIVSKVASAQSVQSMKSQNTIESNKLTTVKNDTSKVDIIADTSQKEKIKSNSTPGQPTILSTQPIQMNPNVSLNSPITTDKQSNSVQESNVLIFINPSSNTLSQSTKSHMRTNPVKSPILERNNQTTQSIALLQENLTLISASNILNNLESVSSVSQIKPATTSNDSSMNCLGVQIQSLDLCIPINCPKNYQWNRTTKSCQFPKAICEQPDLIWNGKSCVPSSILQNKFPTSHPSEELMRQFMCPNEAQQCNIMVCPPGFTYVGSTCLPTHKDAKCPLENINAMGFCNVLKVVEVRINPGCVNGKSRWNGTACENFRSN